MSHITVLADFVEEARREGMELRKALVQAGLVRLRAVLETVFATVRGLIPLTLSGGELWRPLTVCTILESGWWPPYAGNHACVVHAVRAFWLDRTGHEGFRGDATDPAGGVNSVGQTLTEVSDSCG